MKIVHLANHVRNTGNGIVNMMIDLACLQADAGHEVTVASSGGGFEELLARHGVRHVVLRQAREPWRIPAMLAGFNRLIARIGPDVVHAHMMTGALLARFGSVRREYILVTTVHNEFQKSAWLMRFGDCVVAVSEAVGASMCRRGVPRQRIHVIRNGTIGTPRFAGVPMPASPALAHPNIVTVAGMSQRKGIQDLLRAFAQLGTRMPGVSLYLVGEGPDRQAMEALAEELGVAGQTHFTGFIANPRAYLAEADVFVLASHKEPGGLVLSEAREAGCAIVATRVDGNPEMLDGGEAGLLVPPAAPGALAAALEVLMKDEDARRTLARRARHNIASFSAAHVCEAYLSLYERTLEALGPRPATVPMRRPASPDGVVR